MLDFEVAAREQGMTNQRAQLMREYLRLVTAGMSRGRSPFPWQQFLVGGAPVALGVSVAVGCGGDTDPSGRLTKECSGDDCSTACFDGSDNDADGKVDCVDEDCMPYCGQPAYGIPMENDCSNGVDDDGDGQMDCSDTDCYAALACGGGADYAAPIPIEDCGNGVDDDYDGATDCADDDCATDTMCAGALYGVPMEDCANGVDDDGDGALDCSDADCEQDPSCLAVPLYAMPMD
jgi:hypothetical protein